jgi:hypothetical protein
MISPLSFLFLSFSLSSLPPAAEREKRKEKKRRGTGSALVEIY